MQRTAEIVAIAALLVACASNEADRPRADDSDALVDGDGTSMDAVDSSEDTGDLADSEVALADAAEDGQGDVADVATDTVDEASGDVAEDALADPSPDAGDGDADGADWPDDPVGDPTDLADDDSLLQDPASDVTACDTDAECPFGFRCEGESCLEVECHLGSGTLGIADKPCPDGQICDLLVDAEAEWQWVCQAFERSCVRNDDCPFGFLCTGGSCLHADCTVGTAADLGDYGPRPCDEPTDICGCMEDGVDVNGGRGQCVTSPEACE